MEEDKLTQVIVLIVVILFLSFLSDVEERRELIRKNIIEYPSTK